MRVPLVLLSLAPAYRIVDLGMPDGAEKVEAVAINDRGEVLVSIPLRLTDRRTEIGTLWDGGHGYLWRHGQFLDFGDSGGSHVGDEATHTEPKAVNDHGVAVGAKGTFGPTFMSGLENADAFIWRGRKMEDLG